MQNASFDDFLHTLDCATNYKMPKLLACCEYYIATAPIGRFQAELSSLKHPLPISSALRIAAGLRVAFRKVMGEESTIPYIPSPQVFFEMP